MWVCVCRLKGKYREGGSSRSPSGSQSPRRKYKSRSKYRDYKDKYEKAHGVARHSYSKMAFKETTRRERKESFDERDSRSRRRRSNYPSPKERGLFKSDGPSQDIKAIDPKLMEDSINTFLKYAIVVCRYWSLILLILPDTSR